MCLTTRLHEKKKDEVMVNLKAQNERGDIENSYEERSSVSLDSNLDENKLEMNQEEEKKEMVMSDWAPKYYYVLQFLFAIHQCTHEVLDPEVDYTKDQDMLNDKIFFIAVGMFLTSLGLYATCLNTFMSMIFFFCYSIPIIVFLVNHQVLENIFHSYLWTYVILLIVLFLICFS